MSSSSKRPLAFDEQTSWTPPWIRKPAESDKCPLELRENVGDGDIRRFAGVNARPCITEPPADKIPVVPSLDPLVMPQIEALPTTWLRLRILARLVLAVALAGFVAYLVVLRKSTNSTVAMGDPRGEAQPPAVIRDLRRPPTPRLTVTAPSGPLQNGQSFPLRASVSGAGMQATLVINGLAPQARLSAGRPL